MPTTRASMTPATTPRPVRGCSKRPANRRHFGHALAPRSPTPRAPMTPAITRASLRHARPSAIPAAAMSGGGRQRRLHLLRRLTGQWRYRASDWHCGLTWPRDVPTAGVTPRPLPQVPAGAAAGSRSRRGCDRTWARTAPTGWAHETSATTFGRRWLSDLHQDRRSRRRPRLAGTPGDRYIPPLSTGSQAGVRFSVGRSVAQPGSALASGARGREFESPRSDQ